ncbi:MAG: FKBP-type peptidyl-prolyl cis-trans isomerase [Crocinitomicaceae bacterium]
MKKLLLILSVFITSISMAQDELGDGLYAVFTTSKGEITVQLEYEKVPMTVASFVALAEGKMKTDTVQIKEPFFDGIKFHRVIKDFMIQGGDPLGNGSGNPGYFFPDEFDSTLMHDKAGILSMANSGPATNGSQFFITHKATPWLNFKHSVFGHVVKGQDVVNAIEQDDVIEKLTILRIGKGAKKFKANKVFTAELEAYNEKKKAENAVRNSKFKEENIATYPNAVQTESGLMYLHTKVGKGDLPKAGDQIEMHYTGYLPDGKKFESSHDRAQAFKFIYKQQPIMPGWEEALGLMKPGGEMKIIMPSWLGFGAQGKGVIPPNATLVFDLEMIKISDPAEEAKELAASFKAEMAEKYPTAKQTKSGLMYIVEKEGNGTHPTKGQTVSVHYTGTLMNGEKFDSSVDRGKPFEFPIGQGRVIKGWDEGIPLASVGGKIKLIIPHWLAYGPNARPGIPANSHLIFDVEMLDIK